MPLPSPTRRLAALLALAALLSLGVADAARAQDPVGDFFHGLFGSGRPAPSQARRPPAEGQRMRRLVPHREYGAPAYWHGQTRSAKKAKTTKPDDPNAPPFQVAVIGDTLGQQLADGLEDAFADRADIRILHRGRRARASCATISSIGRRPCARCWPAARRSTSPSS